MLKQKSFVYANLPKTGLGNMLLVWAKALVFAKLNNFELVISSWRGLRWGALLRNEQKKRLYWKYFRETPIIQQIIMRFYLKASKIITEPKVEKIDHVTPAGNTLYVFNNFITTYDLFSPIRDHHEIIADELLNLLHPSKKALLKNFEMPVIGVHIRRGDFKNGSLITPLDFFIKGINIIREQVCEEWPVTVFTDAVKEEIAELLALPSIKLAEEKADILDILLLSKSRILLLSAGSTFSYWAAFLSEALVIKPDIDWLKQIKKSATDSSYREIIWKEGDENSTSIFKNAVQML